MSINFVGTVGSNTQNLNQWRNRYPKGEYPAKVILNLFYDLIPLEMIWSDLRVGFEGNVRADSFADANAKVIALHRNTQLKLRTTLQSDLKRGVSVAGLSSSSYSQLIAEARSGNNEAVEEIEFCYITRVAIKSLMLQWAELGLMGRTAANAFEEVADMSYPEMDYGSFEQVFNAFAQAATARIGGIQTPDGRAVSAAVYNPLPPLWSGDVPQGTMNGAKGCLSLFVVGFLLPLVAAAFALCIW